MRLEHFLSKNNLEQKPFHADEYEDQRAIAGLGKDFFSNGG